MSLDSRRPIQFEETANPPISRGIARARPIEELDRVTLADAVEGDDGEIIPAGSTGTVVGIWAGGAAYEVEFTQPVDALATVKAEAIAAHHPR